MKKAISFLKNAKKVLTFGGIVNIQFNIVSSKNSLANKVALITGGTSGFGLAIAKQYLANGAQVIITGRSEKKISDALTILNSPNAKGLIWDICDFEKNNIKMNEALELFGKIDIVVNNAGVWTGRQWNEISEEDWDTIVDTNAKALFFMCQTEASVLQKSAT